MRCFLFSVILLAVGVCLPGCQQDETETVTESPKQVMVLDKQSSPGRVFMYIDDQGNAVKTRNYNQIPLEKRKAVMVLEGRKRARITRAAGGEVRIQALPPVIGSGSTEKWTDEQWREELAREMQKLQKEEEKNPNP